MHLLTHDPTTLNRQGGDVGTQYRSVIFYKNQQEKEEIEALLEEYRDAFPDKIVTEVMPFDVFYPAEDYHQEYYANNSEAAYCQAVISPKLKKLREKFQSKLKSTVSA